MSDVMRALGAALSLDIAYFPEIPVVTALMVALIAGTSTMLGHTAILLLNRIKGWRLVTTMLMNFFSLAFLHVVEAAVTWGVTSLVLRRPVGLMPLILVGLLSLAPHVFAFLQSMPYLGLLIGRVLQGWSFLILWFGVAHVFSLRWVWALAFTLSGWFVMQLLSRLLQRPVGAMSSYLWTLATGRPTMVTSRDVLAGTPFMPVMDRTRHEAET